MVLQSSVYVNSVNWGIRNFRGKSPHGRHGVMSTELFNKSNIISGARSLKVLITKAKMVNQLLPYDIWSFTFSTLNKHRPKVSPDYSELLWVMHI